LIEEVEMSKEPWKVKGAPWKTEAAFYSWIRSQLRRGWSRHPIKNLYLQQNRFKSQNDKGRVVWHLECEQCKIDTPQTKIQIDHLIPAGSLKTTGDLGQFVERLYFVTFDTIRALCIPCHEVITFGERNKIEEFAVAAIEKECVRVMRLNIHELKTWLHNRHEEYVTPKKENIHTVRRLLNA
jgi:hypothetical protein